MNNLFTPHFWYRGSEFRMTFRARHPRGKDESGSHIQGCQRGELAGAPLDGYWLESLYQYGTDKRVAAGSPRCHMTINRA